MEKMIPDGPADRKKSRDNWFKMICGVLKNSIRLFSTHRKARMTLRQNMSWYVSNDDLTWGEPVASGVGGGTLTIINMPTQACPVF